MNVAAAAQTCCIRLATGKGTITIGGGHHLRWLKNDDKGIASIDLMSAIGSDPNAEISDLYFPNDGHLTPAGHSYVAEILARQFSP